MLRCCDAAVLQVEAIARLSRVAKWMISPSYSTGVLSDLSVLRRDERFQVIMVERRGAESAQGVYEARERSQQ